MAGRAPNSRNADGLEASPWEAAEDLADQELREALGGDEEGEERGDPDQSTHDGPAVAYALGNDTSDEEAHDLSHGCTVAKASLPWCCDLVLSFLVELSEFTGR